MSAALSDDEADLLAELEAELTAAGPPHSSPAVEAAGLAAPATEHRLPSATLSDNDFLTLQVATAAAVASGGTTRLIGGDALGRRCGAAAGAAGRRQEQAL